MNCPRCQLTLRNDTYEGQNVMFCDTCWGYWLPGATLNEILRDESTKFSDSERKSVFQTWALQGDANRQGHEDQLINCPQCEVQMKRMQVHPACPVMVDKCAEHGVWLDTGEIKELQIFVERKQH